MIDLQEKPLKVRAEWEDRNTLVVIRTYYDDGAMTVMRNVTKVVRELGDKVQLEITIYRDSDEVIRQVVKNGKIPAQWKAIRPKA